MDGGPRPDREQTIGEVETQCENPLAGSESHFYRGMRFAFDCTTGKKIEI
jgi:hypothetical protein